MEKQLNLELSKEEQSKRLRRVKAGKSKQIIRLSVSDSVLKFLMKIKPHSKYLLRYGTKKAKKELGADLKGFRFRVQILI